MRPRKRRAVPRSSPSAALPPPASPAAPSPPYDGGSEGEVGPNDFYFGSGPDRPVRKRR